MSELPKPTGSLTRKSHDHITYANRPRIADVRVEQPGLGDEQIRVLAKAAYDTQSEGVVNPADNLSLAHAIDKIPEEIGVHFQAHAISPDSRSTIAYVSAGFTTGRMIHAFEAMRQMLRSLNTLLFYGADLSGAARKGEGFYTGQLTWENGTSNQDSFGHHLRSASFVLVAYPDRSLVGNTSRNGLDMMLNTSMVIVGEPWYGVMGELKAAYPRVNFVRAADLDTKENQESENSGPLQKLLQEAQIA